MSDQNLNKVLLASEPHPIFSAIIDMYLFEMYIGVIASFTMYFIKINFLKEVFVVISCILLVALITYHAAYAKKVLWLSPGEILGGRRILDNEKIWQNPYGISRVGLFFACLVALLLFRNSGAITGNLTSLLTIFVFLVKTILVTYSIILIGKGKLRGLTLINIVLLLGFGLSLLSDNSEIILSGYISLGAFFVFTIIGVIYKMKSTKFMDMITN